jgi:imidazolonepropionase-like amidohydrolase
VRTAVRGAQVFDGEGLVPGARSVVFDGPTIVGETDTDADADETVDLDGATLLPGLVDTHQHLVFDGIGTFEEQVAPRTDDELRDRALGHARKALAAGITTVRDLGDRGYVTLDLRGRDDVGTILCAGPPITRPQGHCWYLGGEADGDDGLRAAVRDRAAKGCDVVKVMVTGGHGTPGYPMSVSQFTTDEVRAVVDEADRVGLPVAAHCHGLGGIESALAAGVDSIEHCTFLTEEERSEPHPDLLKRLAASGIGLSFSLGTLDLASAPAFVRANLRTIVQAIGHLLDAGAHVCVGTDAGIAPPKPHDVLPHALGAMVGEGIPPATALRAMTATGADVIGRGATKGRLRPGCDADVLAVDGDPLTDPSALLRPVAVWHRGRRVR